MHFRDNYIPSAKHILIPTVDPSTGGRSARTRWGRRWRSPSRPHQRGRGL